MTNGPSQRRDAADEILQRLGLKREGSEEKEIVEESVADRIKKRYIEGAETKALMEGLGMGRPPETGEKSPPFTLKGELDIGSILNQALETTREAHKEAQGEYRQRLADLERRLEEAKANLTRSPDPLQTFREVKTFLQEVADSIRDRLGLTTNVSATDLPNLIKLEETRMEREMKRLEYQSKMEEDRRKWEEYMEEKRRQWKKEDEDRARLFQLQKIETQNKSATRERATKALERLAGAIIEGLEVEEGKGTEVKMADNYVRAECPECGASIFMPKDVEQVVCGKCGTTYNVSIED